MSVKTGPLYPLNRLHRLHRQWRAVLIVSLAGWLTGCAAFQSRDDDPVGGDEQSATHIESDPILIRATQDGDEVITEYIDAQDAFQRAFQDYQARRYEDALANYQILIEHFPGSRFHLPSLYNGGLASEQLELWRDAITYYRRILDEYPDSSEALNARFRLANALFEVEDFRAVEELLMEILLSDDNLAHFDRIEAHVRRGQALLRLDELSDAENSFRNVLTLNHNADPADRLADDNRFLVQTHFGLGQVHHARMLRVHLVLPTERMAQDISTKVEHALSAQAAYGRALRLHHPYWSVAAGYKIGLLYEDFYLDVFTAEIPEGLTDEQLSIYFQELRNQAQALMDRALHIYERNLSYSRRIADGEADEWIDATALHMSRLRSFLEDPRVQRRAEELVISGGDLRDLWDTGYYARQIASDAIDEALIEIGQIERPDEDDEEQLVDENELEESNEDLEDGDS